MRVTMFLSVVLASAIAGQVLAGDISPPANREFLAAYPMKPGVVVLPSGLMYRVIVQGAGKTPAPTDVVTVSYRGTLVDGLVFDQTKPGETADLPVARLVQGWKEALSLMKEGDEWEVVVPSELGYGRVRSGDIPPNQTLVFQMKLIKVLPPR